MMNNKDNGMISFIASIITIICFVPTLVGLIYGFVINDLKSIIALSIVAGILFVSFSIIFIHAFTKKHKSKFYRWLKYVFAPKENCTLNERNTYYEFISRERIKHSKTFNVYARSTLSSFADRYVYSGDTECKLNAPLQGQKILTEYKRLGCNVYLIGLEVPVHKGNTTELKMEMDEIQDNDHKSKPRLSTGIYEATKKLKMTVKLWEGCIHNNGRIRIYSNYTSLTPFIDEPLYFDIQTRTYTYELDYPIINYMYEIVWEFNDNVIKGADVME